MGKWATAGGHRALASAVADDDGGGVPEWEEGLPCDEDLTPLSQTLITHELASAFSITLEPPRTILDVYRASKDTIALLRRRTPSSSFSRALALGTFPSFAETAPSADPVDALVIEGDESLDTVEEFESPPRAEDPNADGFSRTQKRPRLVWTSQLHKRFVDVVAYLGVKCAVPKTIMHLMNVEGLTRENVASHLQKYRLYLKRMRERTSNSDPPVASTLVPQSPHETPYAPVPVPVMVQVPMPYAAAPALIPMPVQGMTQNCPGARVTMVPVNGRHVAVTCQGFEALHPYAVFEERQKYSTGRNKFPPMAPYSGVSCSDK